MEIFREQRFRFKGEELTVQPNLALLRRIKARGVNNVMTANKCLNGGLDIEDLTIVLHEFLRAAGKDDVTEESCYEYLTGRDTAEVISFQQTYVMSVLPSVDFGKKPEAPQPKKGPTKKASKT